MKPATGQTLIAVDGCIPSMPASVTSAAPAGPSAAALLPNLTLTAVRTVNVTRRYTWSVDRTLTADGVTAAVGSLALGAGEERALTHLLSFRRAPVAAFAKQYRVSGAVDVTNPSDKETLRVASMQVLLRRMGSTDEVVPSSCGGFGGSGAFTLPPRATVRCSYDAAVVEGRPGVAKARATLADGRTLTSSAGGAFGFKQAPAISLGECATVTDDFRVLSAPPGAGQSAGTLQHSGERPPAARLGETPLRLCGSRDFAMEERVGPFGGGRCGTFSYGGKAVARPTSGPQEAVSTPATKVFDVVVKC
jgi:hypothetical protein